MKKEEKEIYPRITRITQRRKRKKEEKESLTQILKREFKRKYTAFYEEE